MCEKKDMDNFQPPNGSADIFKCMFQAWFNKCNIGFYLITPRIIKYSHTIIPLKYPGAKSFAKDLYRYQIPCQVFGISQIQRGARLGGFDLGV